MSKPSCRICFATALAVFVGAPAFADGPLPHRDDLSLKDRDRVAAVTAPPAGFDKPQPFEAMSGGAATSTASVNGNAFSHPSANLKGEARADFFVGNGLFKKVWVSAPSSTQASDGLGPLFNARSCQRCHLKDGRGHPPAGPDDLATSMFLRLSVPPRSEAERAALASKAATVAPNRGGWIIVAVSMPGRFKSIVTSWLPSVFAALS